CRVSQMEERGERPTQRDDDQSAEAPQRQRQEEHAAGKTPDLIEFLALFVITHIPNQRVEEPEVEALENRYSCQGHRQNSKVGSLEVTEEERREDEPAHAPDDEVGIAEDDVPEDDWRCHTDALRASFCGHGPALAL